MRTSDWPDPFDQEGWRGVIDRRELGLCPPGIVVAALRALLNVAEPRLVNALALHVSDRIVARLRRMIGTDRFNDGNDVVERAHGAILVAIFDPASTDGDDLAVAFRPRVRFRGLDAARVEGAHRRRIVSIGTDADGENLASPARRLDGGPSSLDVGHLLSLVADPRKRLAFRLHVEGMQLGSGRPCIAGVLGIDRKTAARWIAEARAILVAAISAGLGTL